MNKIYKVIWSKVRNCYVAVSEIAKRNGKDRTSVTGGAAGRRQAARVLCALLLGAYLTAGYSMPVAWGADGYVIRDGDIIVWGKGTTLSQEVVGAQKTIIINVRAGTNVTADANGVHVIGSETLTNDGKLMTGTAVTTALSSYTKKSDLSAGNGLSLSGTTYSVKANGNSITVGSAGIKVSDTITGDINSLKTTVGDTSSGLVKDVNDNKTALQSKANAATTLAGYGITDAYTKSETDTALAAKADAADVSALNTKTQYVASAGENKTTIAGTLEVVGTNAESGGVINVNGPGSGVNIAGTESFLKVGSGSSNYTLEVDVGNNQVKAASGNIIFNSNGAFTTKYGGSTGQTIFEVNPESNANPIPVLIFNGGINGTATFNGAGDNKVTLKNGAITATGAISGKTIMATDNLYIGTGTNQIDVAAAVAGSGVIAATGETGASGLVKGSTVYDYLNGAKLDLGAESTQIEIGQNSTASGNYAIAIGTDATTATTTASESSIAIGKSAEAKSGYTIAMGTNAKVASGTGTIAIGYNANASGNDTATAIGFGATSFQGTAIGWSANANGAGATALGGFANANSENATAVGLSANATWQNTTAIGRGAEASRVNSEDPSIYLSTESATALGAFAKAQNDYATAVGANAQASGLNSIAIGGGTRPDTGTITAATAVGEGSIAIGKGANTTAEQATAVGMNTSAVANGTAIGYNAKANKNTSTAIGYGAKADGNGENATAIGYDSSATGNTSIAIAGSASASLAIAVGRSTSATAERAIGIGVETAASGIRSVAIGSNTSATVANSVALGSNSVANRADYATTNYKAYLNEDDSKTDSAWRSTHSAVAVGNGTTVTRQITGVAAGTADTDAVNVAQLKSATPMINSEHNYYDGATTAVKVTDAVNAVDAALGKVAAGSNYLAVYDATTPTGTFAENLTALDTAIGKVTSDGNYIKESSTKNVAENLSLLDAQAKTNADNIGTLQTKTQNITATAGTTIMEGVLNVVPAGGTTGIAISGTDKTITGLSNITWNASAITSGRAATEDQLQLATSSLSTTLTDTGLQFGANLNTATNNDTVVTNKLGSQVKVLGGGAQSGHTYSAANVTTEITQEAGNSTIIIKLDHNPTFGNISGASLAVSGMLSSASLKVNNIDVTTPLTTPGAVASGNPGFVIGGTVYSEVRPTADGNYVKTANTTAANLTVLDTQVKTNADNITALQSSTTAAVGTLTEDGNYIKKSSTNNIVQNLSALDTQVKTNTDDIATLKNSISVQEDASGTKTTTIEGNLVIKEEDGTTKDVTAALSTDGEVAKKGDAGSEGFLKGETVYDYLNKGDNGKEVKLATESQQISIGKGSEASGAESIAIGNEVGTQKNQATGTQSIAIGFGNQVSGNHSGAIGDPTYIAADNSYAIGNSNNITATGTRSFAIGNNNTIGGSDTFVLGSNVNTNAANAVVLGNNSTGEANAVSVGSVGGERQIKHVAPGTDANDAATVGQLGALAQAADNSIGRLDSKVNKVGAGAAALAALHPIDTDDKFTMGLGYGNYRNAHSAAIGLFYRPTEKVMISVGGTLGNGENMINAGISFALDKGKGFGTSKAAMARKIAAQDEEIAALKEAHAKENAENKAEIQALKEALARLEAKIGK